jgi:hypothetical protein
MEFLLGLIFVVVLLIGLMVTKQRQEIRKLNELLQQLSLYIKNNEIKE